MSLYTSVSSVPNSNGDNDDEVLSFKGWELAGMTVLVCFLLFAIGGLFWMYANKSTGEHYQSTLQDEEVKEALRGEMRGGLLA